MSPSATNKSCSRPAALPPSTPSGFLRPRLKGLVRGARVTYSPPHRRMSRVARPRHCSGFSAARLRLGAESPARGAVELLARSQRIAAVRAQRARTCRLREARSFADVSSRSLALRLDVRGTPACPNAVPLCAPFSCGAAFVQRSLCRARSRTAGLALLLRQIENRSKSTHPPPAHSWAGTELRAMTIG